MIDAATEPKLTGARMVGGLEGASRRYDLDYWFSSMREALNQLEAYLRRTAADDANWPTQVYSVAVCGERVASSLKPANSQISHIGIVNINPLQGLYT
jgi:hypothetical protein